MTVYFETMSNTDQSFDWYKLPPGQYKMKGDELFRVIDDKQSDCNIAADNFLAALRKLV
jgi:hypothetical protein